MKILVLDNNINTKSIQSKIHRMIVMCTIMSEVEQVKVSF